MARPRKTVTPADPNIQDGGATMTAVPGAEVADTPTPDTPQPDTTPATDDALLGLVEETDPTLPPPAPDAAASPAPDAAPARQRNLPLSAQVAALVLGGAVAAAFGFAAARMLPTPADNSTLAQTVEQQARDLADLRAALAERPTGEAPDLTPIANRLAALEARVANAPTATGPDLSGDVAALRDQITAISKNGGEDAQRIKAAADQAQAAIGAAQAQAQALSDRAKSELAAARRQLAIGRLQAALDTGAAYPSALIDLGGNVPDVLKTHAQTGLPTLAALRAAWPDAARAALNAALRAQAGADWADRISLFFRTQTGARSLTPKDGNDPDAVLSRAGAALDKNDLATALAEIAKLPPEGQRALADVTALAQTRQAAADAIAALAAAQ